MQTSNSCNTGKSADISDNARVPVLQLYILICYTFSTRKICPNVLLTALPIYIAKDSHCDYGILILMFP